MRREVYVVQWHPGSEPDRFRLTDTTARICGVFYLPAKPHQQTTSVTSAAGAYALPPMCTGRDLVLTGSIKPLFRSRRVSRAA